MREINCKKKLEKKNDWENKFLRILRKEKKDWERKLVLRVKDEIKGNNCGGSSLIPDEFYN